MMEDTPITPAVAAEERPRVKFGTKPHQVIPFEWAEAGICWLYENKRQTFADMMLIVMDTGFQTGNARKNSTKTAANGHQT